MRSVTQPEGHPIPEFSLAHRDRLIAEKLDTAIKQLTASRPQLQGLTDGITRLDDGLAQIASGNALAANGSGEIANGSAAVRGGLGVAFASSGELSAGSGQLAAGSLELANGIESAVNPILDLLDTVAPPPAARRPPQPPARRTRAATPTPNWNCSPKITPSQDSCAITSPGSRPDPGTWPMVTSGSPTGYVNYAMASPAPLADLRRWPKASSY